MEQIRRDDALTVLAGVPIDERSLLYVAALYAVAADLAAQVGDEQAFDEAWEKTLELASSDVHRHAVAGVCLLSSYAERCKDPEMFKRRIDQFAPSLGENYRGLLWPLYLAYYRKVGAWDQAYDTLWTMAKYDKTDMDKLVFHVLEGWPILLTRLGRWNHRGELIRYAKRSASLIAPHHREELVRHYLQVVRTLWADFAFREVELMLELARIVIPPGSELEPVLRQVADEFAFRDELEKLIWDARLPDQVKARISVWYGETGKSDLSAADEFLSDVILGLADDESIDGAALRRAILRIQSSYRRIHGRFAGRLQQWLQELA
jgi:hypothetical protein